jgi:hypothetical protein
MVSVISNIEIVIWPDSYTIWIVKHGLRGWAPIATVALNPVACYSSDDAIRPDPPYAVV